MHEEPNNPWRTSCFVMSVVCAAALAVAVIVVGETAMFRRQAIERGYAEYNQKTGLWQWKEKAE